jgi:hypothetical protein
MNAVPVPPPSPRKRHRTLLGCVVALGICGLSILLAILIAGWQMPGVARRVESAVRASFPGFCNGASDHMTVQLSGLPASWMPNRYWDIRCDPGSEWAGPAMTIDAQTCSVLVPQYGVPEWYQSYGWMYVDGQRMAVCP